MTVTHTILCGYPKCDTISLMPFNEEEAKSKIRQLEKRFDAHFYCNRWFCGKHKKFEIRKFMLLELLAK